MPARRDDNWMFFWLCNEQEIHPDLIEAIAESDGNAGKM
jgi:hypothetical protein